MGRFNKGFFLGGLLGAGLIWLSTTKKGRETREQALIHAEKIFEIAKARAMETGSWDKLSKTKFAEIAKGAAGEYSTKTGLAGNVVKIAEYLVNSRLGELRKEARGKK